MIYRKHLYASLNKDKKIELSNCNWVMTAKAIASHGMNIHKILSPLDHLYVIYQKYNTKDVVLVSELWQKSSSAKWSNY